MKMNEPLNWSSSLSRLADFNLRIARGRAVEVTHRAPRFFGGRPIAIEADTFDRFVAWDGEALRHHSILLEEDCRLQLLLEASGNAAFGDGGCFVSKAVDARGSECRTTSRVFTMTNFGGVKDPAWLIHI